MSYCVRAGWRRRLRGGFSLAVIVGLAAGVALSMAAGARRTESSYDRLLNATQPVDLRLLVPQDEMSNLLGMASLREAILFDNWFGVVDQLGDEGPTNLFAEVALIAPADAAAAKAVGRSHIVAGRLPAADAADEMSLSYELVDELGLGVGDVLPLILSTPEQLVGLEQGLQLPSPELGVPVRFRVVGVHAVAGELPPRSSGTDASPALVSPAFAEAYAGLLDTGTLVGIRVEGGEAGLGAFRQEFEELAGFPLEMIATPLSDRHDLTRDAIGLSATALWALAGLAAIIAALLAAQGLARQVMVDTAEWPPLVALGASSGQLIRLAVARSALIAGVAAVVAVVVSSAVSPVFPVGLARTAEVEPGVSFDPAAVAIGLVVLVAAIGLFSAVAARREVAARDRRVAGGRTARSAQLSRAVSRGGFGPSVSAGVSLALETGRGPGSVPMRSTVAGAVVTFAAVAAALSFGAGLDHLLRTPSLSGVHWDVQYGDGWGQETLFGSLATDLRDSPDVEAVAAGTVAELEIAGTRIAATASQPIRGDLGATVVEGRAPVGPDELFLGTQILRASGLSVGDLVEVRALAAGYDGPSEIMRQLGLDPEAGIELFPTRPMRIVGSGVTPEGLRVGLGFGALLTLEGLDQLSPYYAPRNMYRLRWVEGVDPAVARAHLHPPDVTVTAWIEPNLPQDLVNFGRTRSLPWIVAGLMGMVGVALLCHLLVTTVRRRGRELALLKTLGLTPVQVSYAVAVQATVLVGIAAVVGLPVGVVLGRWAWTALADDAGVIAVPVVPVGLLALATGAALLIANLAAAVAAHRTRRTPPAVILRTR